MKFRFIRGFDHAKLLNVKMHPTLDLHKVLPPIARNSLIKSSVSPYLLGKRKIIQFFHWLIYR